MTDRKAPLFERPVVAINSTLGWLGTQGLLLWILLTSDNVVRFVAHNPRVSIAIAVGMIAITLTPAIYLQYVLATRSRRLHEAIVDREHLGRDYQKSLKEVTDLRAADIQKRDDQISQLLEEVTDLRATPDPSDVALMREFLHLLPPSGRVITLLRSPFFSPHRFPSWVSDSLHDYATKWTDPLHTFHDQDVEVVRLKFDEKVADFFRAQSNRVWIDHPNRPDELVVPPEWQLHQQKRYEEAIDVMEAAFQTLLDAYDEFLSAAKRRKLA